MKKTIFVIICILVIIGIGVGEQIYVDKTLSEITNKVETISSILIDKNYSLAKDEIEELMQWWYKKRDFLEFICPNNDLKDIAKEIGELYGSTLIESDDDPFIRCQVIIELTKNSKDLLDFKWKNIF